MSDTEFPEAIHSLFARSIQELAPADGLPVSELDDAEQELGFRIPQPLRDYYSTTGKTEFNQAFNRFRAPAAIKQHGDLAIFCEENQCVVYYGFKVSAAGEKDPEVWQLNPSENKWYFDCKRMTTFLLDMVCWQAVCGGVSASAKGSISMAQYEELESTYERIDFGEADHEYALQAFHKNGVIVCAFPDDYRCQVFCGSNSKSKLKRVANRLRLDML